MPEKKKKRGKALVAVLVQVLVGVGMEVGVEGWSNVLKKLRKQRPTWYTLHYSALLTFLTLITLYRYFVVYSISLFTPYCH